MLLKYSVSNFKSIVNNIEFDMFPLGDSCDTVFLTEINTVVEKHKILRRSAFLGSNISDNTSLIESLDYAINYIIKDSQNVVDELNNVAIFQFMFYINSQVYNYGFSLDKNYVHEEWLAILNKNGNFDTLFDRQTDSELTTKIIITDNYAKVNTEERRLAELLAKSIQEDVNHLFLNKLYKNASKHAINVVSWFKHIQIIYPNTELPIIDNSSNTIYIINNLDFSLDTELVKYITDSMNDSECNKQFLFTTHDIKLLVLKKFQQEEIWFIWKDNNGETILKPFSDYYITNEENIIKDYLSGRYSPKTSLR